MQDINFDEITPDEFNQWLNQSIHGFRFRQLMPVADRQTKFAKSADEERAVFRLFPTGSVTTETNGCTISMPITLGKKVRTFINLYEETRAEHGGNDVQRQSWTVHQMDS